MSAAPVLQDYLRELQDTIEQALELVIPPNRYPTLIADAMRYSLMGGGKRLRPCLTLAVAERAGAEQSMSADAARSLALPAACAVEMIVPRCVERGIIADQDAADNAYRGLLTVCSRRRRVGSGRLPCETGRIRASGTSAELLATDEVKQAYLGL